MKWIIIIACQFVFSYNIVAQDSTTHKSTMRSTLKDLNLSRSQLKQLKELRQKNKAAEAEIENSNKTAEEKAAAKRAILLNQREEMKKILTEEQRTKFKTLHAKKATLDTTNEDIYKLMKEYHLKKKGIVDDVTLDKVSKQQQLAMLEKNHQEKLSSNVSASQLEVYNKILLARKQYEIKNNNKNATKTRETILLED